MTHFQKHGGHFEHRGGAEPLTLLAAKQRKSQASNLQPRDIDLISIIVRMRAPHEPIGSA